MSVSSILTNKVINARDLGVITFPDDTEILFLKY